MQRARSDRLLELIIRLRHDLPNRALAAFGVAGALFCYINVGLASIWLALVAFNEILELWLTREITRGGAVANRFEAAFLINLAFGSTAWGSAAWVFWTSGGVAGIVIGLAVALGALYHVSCHFISHAPSLAAAGVPLAAAYLALPVQMNCKRCERILPYRGLTLFLNGPGSSSSRRDLGCPFVNASSVSVR